MAEDQMAALCHRCGSSSPMRLALCVSSRVKTGTVDDFLNAIEYWERKQSLAILGGTLTSQADGKTSTNALGAIHNEVREEIRNHDERQIVPTVQVQLVRPVVLLNLNPAAHPPDRPQI